MSNRIVYVTKDEAKEIKTSVLQNEDIFFVEIDGDKIATEEDYVRVMSDVFNFPHELPEMKIGWYNDYINDLMWIKQKDIVVLIHDYELMLTEDLRIKKIIMSDFEEIILPWWEGEVVGHLVGGRPRRFIIYLENSN